jgi:hypothetical protein
MTCNIAHSEKKNDRIQRHDSDYNQHDSVDEKAERLDIGKV